MITTHDMQFARSVFDTAYLLENGVIVEKLHRKHLDNSKGKLARLMHSHP